MRNSKVKFWQYFCGNLWTQSHYNVRYGVPAGSLLRRMLFSGWNPSRCREYYFQTCSSFAPFAAALATLFFPDFAVKADGRNYRSYFLTYLQEQQRSIRISYFSKCTSHIELCRIYRITERAFSERDMSHRPINSSMNSSTLYIAIKNDNHLITDEWIRYNIIVSKSSSLR